MVCSNEELYSFDNNYTAILSKVVPKAQLKVHTIIAISIIGSGRGSWCFHNKEGKHEYMCLCSFLVAS